MTVENGKLKKPLRVYIAGKISGLDDLTVAENFARGRRIVEGYGHEPLCPWTIHPPNHDWQWSDYMIADLRIVMEQAQAIFMLAGWRDSKGARIEHFIAGELGLKVWYECEVPEA